MSNLDTLVDTLLYEGYALSPYTPATTSSATPAPFGILYPPGYTEATGSGSARLALECIALATGSCALEVEIRFLQRSVATGEAVERRVRLAEAPLARVAQSGVDASFRHVALVGRARASAHFLEADMAKLTVEVENKTDLPGAGAATMARSDALGLALLATHVIARIDGGRFVSPLAIDGAAGRAARDCRSVNTWPVLASPNDDTILGAALVLPDHPEIAPQSGGALSAGTEIEEALVLHVLTLAAAEREEIARRDPKIRAALARVAAAAPERSIDLHGGVRPADAPPEVAGESSATAGGLVFRRGDRVKLRLGASRDPHAVLLDGMAATIRRIHRGMDDRVYLAVTVDADPRRAFFGATARFLWFFPHEVEVAEP